MTPCPSETPQDLPLEHDQPERAGQRGEGHAGRRYQLVFRRANILPYFSHVQCLYSISKYLINYSVLTFHFNKFNVAPVPGIALGWVWRLGPRAVQPADGGLLPPDVGGALGEGERFDPVGHSSAEQQTNAAPLNRWFIRFLAPAVLWPVYARQDSPDFH